jgi:bifunctional DNase/RNase
MFSREVTNEYGSYSKKNSNTILFKGVFDKNFRELNTIDPNTESYKVFNCPSQSINFAVKLGNNIYVPQHLFAKLETAFKENNPYYTINDLVTIEMDLSKTINYIGSKFGVKDITTNSITYTGQLISGSQSGSIQVTSTPSQTLDSRLGLAGVTQLNFQYYINDDSNLINEENVIKQILFLFDETNIRINGTYKTLPDTYIPTKTDVVKPVTSRVTALDDYLKDVKRN